MAEMSGGGERSEKSGSPAAFAAGLVGRAADPSGGPNPSAWSAQPPFFTERARGVGVYWPAEATWFVNDPLPPSPHSHPGASEIYFVAAGKLRLTVGRTEFEMSAGDLCLIPKGAFHHPQGTKGTDLFLWCVVAPNWRGERWKRSAFGEKEFSGVPCIANVSQPRPLPGDDLLQSSCVLLEPGESEEPVDRPGSERAVYVLDGSAQIAIGRLSGRLERHEFVHVPSGAPHRIVNPGPEPLRFLSVYAFDPPGRGISDELGVPPGKTY